MATTTWVDGNSAPLWAGRISNWRATILWGDGHSSEPENWQQNTQELRLVTRPAKNHRWDAVFGLFRQAVDQSRIHAFAYVTPGSFPFSSRAQSSNHTQSLAAYGDVTWHATEKFDVSGGLRVSRDRAAMRYQVEQTGPNVFGGSASTQENTWLGKLSAGYQISTALRTYASVSQGYKPRGYNLAPSTPADAAGFARERATSYEVGARWRRDAVRAELALYRVQRLRGLHRQPLAVRTTHRVESVRARQSARCRSLVFTTMASAQSGCALFQ